MPVRKNSRLNEFFRTGIQTGILSDGHPLILSDRLLPFKKEGCCVDENMWKKIREDVFAFFTFSRLSRADTGIDLNNKNFVSKIIAIHQPNYLPWLGYFYKISQCDIFIFHDNVELTKKGYTRRANIRKGNEAEKIFLTVPLKKHSDFTLIKELEIANQENWQQKHLNKLNAAYSKTPFFGQQKNILEHLFKQKINTLSDLNIAFIQSICQILDLKTTFVLSSELPVTGKGSDYNLNLCKHFNATHYASGKGAKNYQDEHAFQEEGIEILYNDFFSYLKENPYTQHQKNFIAGLSIVDALFNIGPEGIKLLFENYSIS